MITLGLALAWLLTIALTHIIGYRQGLARARVIEQEVDKWYDDLVEQGKNPD